LVNGVLSSDNGSPCGVIVVVVDRNQGADDCVMRIAEVNAGALAGLGVWLNIKGGK